MKLRLIPLLLLAACRSLTPSPAGHGALAVAQPRCEHRVDPLGIAEPRPHLDWQLEARDPLARGLQQSAWQVLAASDPARLERGQADLWDSGKVLSRETCEVEYAGTPLDSGRRVFWKVRAWDQDGAASDWSPVASFSMGLLAPQDWSARWIGYDAPRRPPAAEPGFDGAHWLWFAGDDAAAPPAGVRKLRGRWDVPAGLAARPARQLLSVDDAWEVWLNGEQLAALRDEPDAWRRGADLDVTGKLRAGENVIAIAARNSAAGPAGALAKLSLAFGTPEARSWTSDATWRASDSAPAGWNAIAFDDSGWPAARDLGEHGVAPWGRVGPQRLVLPPPRCLRKEFELERDVVRATLYASALGLVEVELNGRRVGDELFVPGWTDYDKRVYYRTWDATALVRRGANAVGALLADGWYAGYVGYGGRREHYGDKTRALVQLVVEHADGRRTVVASDGSWKAAVGPLLEADFLMGESYDATRELAGWSEPGFDDRAWAAVDVGDAGGAALEPHPGEPVRAIAELEPVSSSEVAPDTWVLGLGQNIAGFARLRLRGERGRKVVLRFAERLNPDGTLYTANLRSARATDTYVCKGDGEELWQPRFTFHGFQYIEVSGLGREPEPGEVVGVAVSSDTPLSGSFECSEPMLNRLFSNTRWTQRMNFIDVPTDCPQRDERLGWTGDAQAYIRTASFVADAQAFYTKWLVDLADAQRADGQFPMVAPLKVAGDDGGPAWSDAGVICPWAVYEVYGDRRLLERHYDSMVRFVEFCRARSDGLLPPKQFHCFGDWVAINADTPNAVIYSAYFALSAQLLARSASALGREADARRWSELHASLRQAFAQAYVDPTGRIAGDTQCAYVLALAFDLLDGEQREQAARRLVELIEARGWHLSTGFVGTKDLMFALSKSGRDDVAYRLLLNTTFPSWGFTIANGATSIWERWDGWTPDKGFQDPGMNSFAHYAFGAVTQWMFEVVGGIRCTAPGFAQAEIGPRPGGGLTWAKVGYRSIRGPFASEWRLDGDAFALELGVPPNATALVRVPTRDAASVTEGGRPAAQAPGVRFVRAEAQEALFEVGSGRYRFACGQPVVQRLAR